MIVVDASVFLDLLVGADDATAVVERVLRGRESLHAPDLVDVEVASGLRRYAALRILGRERAERALADFLALRIERHAHGTLLARAWELRASVTSYDAMYVALAEALDVRLLTRDARLARAHGHRARVELI
jgi:predicted nucleic acid-binding protein